MSSYPVHGYPSPRPIMSIEDFIAYFAMSEKWYYPDDFSHFETRASYGEYCLWILQEPKRWLLDRLSIEEAVNVLYTLPRPSGDTRLPADLRKDILRSELCVFRQVFEPLLSSSEKINERLASVCFMWWDNFACEDPEYALIFRTICKPLLKSHCQAVQESALHGLGHHICITSDEQAVALVDQFLRENVNASPDLTNYAKQAKKGRVL